MSEPCRWLSRRVLVVVVALALGASACGGGGDSDAAESSAGEGGALSGRATDSAGRPVVGASVSIYGRGFDNPAAVRIFIETDAEGRYSADVPPGYYGINV